MAEPAALLADEVFPDMPLRQWVISFPFPLRCLFAAHPQAMGDADIPRTSTGKVRLFAVADTISARLVGVD